MANITDKQLLTDTFTAIGVDFGEEQDDNNEDVLIVFVDDRGGITAQFKFDKADKFVEFDTGDY